MSNNIRRYRRLWLSLATRSIATQVTYRGEFLAGIARNMGYIALALVFYQVLFLHTDRIAGWDQAAILTLFGTFRLVKGLLYFLVEENIDALPDLVRSGDLDAMLLKPASTRFLLSFTTVNLGAASNALIGVGLVVYAVRAAPPAPTAVVGYLLLVLCAVIIFYNLLFALLTVSFWAGKVDGLQYLFDEILNLAGIPVSVYRGALGVVVSYIVPLGVAATVPAGLLTGHPAPFFYLYAPLLAVVTTVASQALWRYGLAAYTGAGS